MAARRKPIDDSTEHSSFEKWTRDPQPGQMLRLHNVGVDVVRLDADKAKRRDQAAQLFKGAPDDVRDAGVAALEADSDDQSDIVSRATISTERVDSYDSTLAVDGWEHADFRKNPVVLFAHESHKLPIGRDIGVFADMEKRALIGVTRFVSEKLGREEAKVGKWVAARMLNATSVGFEPLEWEVAEDRDDGESWFVPVNFLRQALREYSYTPIPANPDCLVDARAFEGLGVDMTDFRRMIEEALDGTEAFYIPRRTLLELKRSVVGTTIVMDLGKLGTFTVRDERADGDLVCPACGHEGPAADFSPGSEEPSGDGEAEGEGEVDEAGSLSNDVTDERALADLAGSVVDIIATGRLP
jgi:hypothetical protein